MTVRFKKVRENAIIPSRATDGSAGYDMCAEIDEPVEILPHDCLMIPSGIAMECPNGYAGLIFARSGLSVKHGLRPATCVSVIDSDYRGEIGLPLRNDGNETKKINPHDRIAQLLFLKVEAPTIEVVDSLNETDRGEGGYGSTGR